MSFLFALFLTLLVMYTVIVSYLAIGYLLMPLFRMSGTVSQPLSIIICARNEESHILACLRSIKDQHYNLSHIQVIVVNDASSDNTLQLAEQELLQSGIPYLLLSNSSQLGKKRSILLALAHCAHELIVLRDADTTCVSPNWLSNLAACYQQQTPDLIIAPLGFEGKTGILWALQSIENKVLTLFAAGSAYYHRPFLCSGANMAFTQTIFRKAGGFQSHLHIASGDDVLFLQDVKRVSGAKIVFLKSPDALVETYPELSFKNLFLQKVRWAAKFKHTRSVFNSFLAVTAFLLNLAFLPTLVVVFLSPACRTEAVLFICLKMFIDILLLFLASDISKNKTIWLYVLPVSFLYPLYVMMVGCGALFIKPKWKP